MSTQSEKIWNVLADRGASIVCPICQGNEWKGFGALGNLSAVLPAATPEGEMVKVPGEMGGMGVYVYSCANCGFVRLHSTEVVDNPVPEPMNRH